MQNAVAERIEADIRRLTLTDQLWLMERLAQHIRRQAAPDSSGNRNALAAMAQDPEVRRELQEIDAEFAETERDGLAESA